MFNAPIIYCQTLKQLIKDIVKIILSKKACQVDVETSSFLETNTRKSNVMLILFCIILIKKKFKLALVILTSNFLYSSEEILMIYVQGFLFY